MDSNPDKHFFDLFMIVMGSIVAVTFGLFLLANYIASHTQEVYILEETDYQKGVDARIAPAAHVALDGETLENAGEVAKIEPVAVVLSGPQVYNQACVACHGAGIAGAPKTGDTTAWGPRIAQGTATLHEHVINGYQGSTGYMPPKGGRTDLSDDEIFSAMNYIIKQAQ